MSSRLEIIKDHFVTQRSRHIVGTDCSSENLPQALNQLDIPDVEVLAPPQGLENEFNTIFTVEAVSFIAELVQQFDKNVDQMLQARIVRKANLDSSGALPDFLSESRHIRESSWKVKPVPRRLINRHIDLGDVSPSNEVHLKNALKSKAQAIQVDFDDGHCPSWKNQLLGYYNIYNVVYNKYPDIAALSDIPVLMLRPRAWNMVDHAVMVNGKEVAGPLLDFGLLIYHFGHILLANESGPFFYLSKLEGHKEARLWNKVFDWSQQKLELPHGCIKACVLIENILSSFEMHEILYELRDHSAGLNCGIWDYSASFVNKFGHRSAFLLPDRNKYVNMEKHFLKSYMDLVVQTCHRRGCHATGGMSALLLPNENSKTYREVLQKTTSGKLREIEAGVDGFLVYDIRLIDHMHKLFDRHAPTVNQLFVNRSDVKITAQDLLVMPRGGVTFAGLLHNIAVGVLFIYSWLRSESHR
ncbi:uncharacterized protein LOC100367444 [Saccoglossus kowalevskii]|uniref:malate synthase n=1 Tax=Saccoglossus kowalevskii TaxID=10224 RepID=A0ABM0MVK3_SACKO|nr:PREDICTED: malate synthase, glyoxysomal-like [Saccoglossus kowalevskii]